MMDYIEYDEYIENALNEAEKQLKDSNTKYYTHEEMMKIAKEVIDEQE